MGRRCLYLILYNIYRNVSEGDHSLELSIIFGRPESLTHAQRGRCIWKFLFLKSGGVILDCFRCHIWHALCMMPFGSML